MSLRQKMNMRILEMNPEPDENGWVETEVHAHIDETPHKSNYREDSNRPQTIYEQDPIVPNPDALLPGYEPRRRILKRK